MLILYFSHNSLLATDLFNLFISNAICLASSKSGSTIFSVTFVACTGVVEAAVCCDGGVFGGEEEEGEEEPE